MVQNTFAAAAAPAAVRLFARRRRVVVELEMPAADKPATMHHVQASMVAVFAVVELRAGAPSPIRVILVVEVAFAARKGWITKAVGAFFLAIKAKPLAAVITLAADFVPAV